MVEGKEEREVGEREVRDRRTCSTQESMALAEEVRNFGIAETSLHLQWEGR